MVIRRRWAWLDWLDGTDPVLMRLQLATSVTDFAVAFRAFRRYPEGQPADDAVGLMPFPGIRP